MNFQGRDLARPIQPPARPPVPRRSPTVILITPHPPAPESRPRWHPSKERARDLRDDAPSHTSHPRAHAYTRTRRNTTCDGTPVYVYTCVRNTCACLYLSAGGMRIGGKGGGGTGRRLAGGACPRSAGVIASAQIEYISYVFITTAAARRGYVVPLSADSRTTTATTTTPSYRRLTHPHPSTRQRRRPPSEKGGGGCRGVGRRKTVNARRCYLGSERRKREKETRLARDGREGGGNATAVGVAKGGGAAWERREEGSAEERAATGNQA